VVVSSLPWRAGQEWPDPVSFLGGVPEQAVTVDGVAGASPDLGAGDVASGLQVGHDDLGGALGDVGGGGNIPYPGAGVAGDLHQHVPVPRQKRLGAAALIGKAHAL
jgi:hypothetical protein